MFFATILAASAFLALSQAQGTASLFLPDFEAEPDDYPPLQGYVIISDAATTTYSISCPATAVNPVCSVVPTSFSVTAGPSTIHYRLDDPRVPGEDVIDFACVMTGSTSASCSTTYTWFSSVWTDANVLGSSNITYMPLVLMASPSGSGL